MTIPDADPIAFEVMPPVIPLACLPEGYKPAPDVRYVRFWSEPDDKGNRRSVSRIEIDGERFPYCTSGGVATRDLIPGRPQFGTVVLIPVVAQSFQEIQPERQP